MKFLGIRDCHDANITYTDGTKVKYLKFERNFQQKHWNWGHQNGDIMEFIIKEGSKILGYDVDELDAICISHDASNHKIEPDVRFHELAIEVDKSKNPFWDQFKCPVWRIDHHYSHALSTWPLVKLDECQTHFVNDGLADHQRVSSIFKGYGDNAKLVDYMDRTETLGLSIWLEELGKLYGMKGMVLDISGKVMALKSFHRFTDEAANTIMELTEPYQYRHINAFAQNVMRFMGEDFFKKEADNEEAKQAIVDLTYLLHLFAERKMPKYFSQFTSQPTVPGCNNVTYSGGTAQNTVVNTKLHELYGSRLHIPPHCYDGGISLGCVEFLRQKYKQDYFDNSNFPYWQSDEAPATQPSESTLDKTAEMLAQGKIVGWYQGNGEVGPRALGNRSILMDPSIQGGKDIINSKVKKREPYRPFGASVLLEYTPDLFEWSELHESPYMLHVVKCLDDRYKSIMHVDNTCRIQTVNQQPQYETYYSLIDKFRQKTGIPMVLNTSLNVDGKPIAGNCSDAKLLFDTSELDAVVIGDEILTK